jgi:hypothetical protein
MNRIQRIALFYPATEQIPAKDRGAMINVGLSNSNEAKRLQRNASPRMFSNPFGFTDLPTAICRRVIGQ